MATIRKGFSVSVNLEHFFNDCRKSSRVYVSDRCETVNDLRLHIEKLFNIKFQAIMIGNDDLPMLENINVIKDGDTIIAAVVNNDESISQDILKEKGSVKHKNGFLSEESLSSLSSAHYSRISNSNSLMFNSTKQRQECYRNGNSSGLNVLKNTSCNQVTQNKKAESTNSSSSESNNEDNNNCLKPDFKMIKNVKVKTLSAENCKGNLNDMNICQEETTDSSSEDIDSGDNKPAEREGVNILTNSNCGFKKIEIVPASKEVKNSGSKVSVNNNCCKETTDGSSEETDDEEGKVTNNKIIVKPDKIKPEREMTTPITIQPKLYRKRKYFHSISSVLDRVNSPIKSIEKEENGSLMDGDNSPIRKKRKRHRVRHRKKKDKSIPLPTVSEIIKIEYKPPNVSKTPKIHIRFNNNKEMNEEKDISDKDDDEKQEPVEKTLERIDNEIMKLFQDKKLTDCEVKKYPKMEELRPQANDIICFKILKMDDNFSPTISDFITGHVLSYSRETEILLLKILAGNEECKEPTGKFSLIDEEQENAKQFEKVKEFNWHNLIEPRLVFP